MDGDLGAVTPHSLDDAYQPPIYFPPVQKQPPPLEETKLKRRTLTRSIAFPEALMEDYTLAKLRRWIVCFAVVEFNLDTGVSLVPHPRSSLSGD